MTAQLSFECWTAYTTADLPTGSDSSGKLLDLEMATDVSFLPPLSRRRLSGLTRLSLRLAHECAPEFQGFCVFGSQHGEILTTQKLLESIASNELVSPAGFSSSVHNTAVGMHSINNKNEFPCTSVSAGVDTLTMCFFEAYALLKSGITDKVLVVYADDRIPDGLAEFVADENVMRGFAALVTTSNAGTPVTIRQKENKITNDELCQVHKLAAALIEKPATVFFDISGERIDWRWEINGK